MGRRWAQYGKIRMVMQVSTDACRVWFGADWLWRRCRLIVSELCPGRCSPCSDEALDATHGDGSRQP
jgi:hypothetical protein